jgi:hypothetical protein
LKKTKRVKREPKNRVSRQQREATTETQASVPQKEEKRRNPLDIFR